MRVLTSAVQVLSALVVAILIAFGLVQFQQWLFRHRAERLLTDFQSIRLHQSTWTVAQKLMQRWGTWGHYDGQCTARNCGYVITITDTGSKLIYKLPAKTPTWIYAVLARPYIWLGGREGFMRVSFQVQDDVIWSSGVGLRLLVNPGESNKEDEYGYGLLLSVRASDALQQNDPHGPWIAGANEQLAEHPYSKEGRPSGCKICMASEVTFTPFLGQVELKQLTSYNLSCITRFRPCLTLSDVLPIARGWHLYPSIESDPEPPPPTGPPQPCDIPVFVSARDAAEIFVVDVVSVQKLEQTNDEIHPYGGESAKVHILYALKGAPPADTRSLVVAVPYAYDTNFPSEAAEQLHAGRRYILFAELDEKKLELTMGRCGVVEDTPAAREEVKKGLLQIDSLRRVEQSGSLWW